MQNSLMDEMGISAFSRPKAASRPSNTRRFVKYALVGLLYAGLYCFAFWYLDIFRG